MGAVEKDGPLSKDEVLRLTANAVERTILHIADNFARKVPELITSATARHGYLFRSGD